MRKGFLLKVVVLFLLAVALAVLVTVMRSSFEFSQSQAARTQTFFEQFIIAGGPIVWFVLLPMSLIMVYLAAEHSITIRRNKLLPVDAGTEIVEMLQNSNPGKLTDEVYERNDFVGVALIRALTQGKGDWFRIRTLIAESLQEQAMTLLRKIEWLSLIGNVSPMVGLFGTVFGMIKLFNAIVTAGGQPQPAQLAGGISVALVTTFWGLFIAIPALAIHGIFRNRIETLANDAVVEAENVMPRIRKVLLKQKQNSKSREQNKTADTK